LNKTLSVFLIIAILGAIGCLAYVIATPQQNEKFSEFYILGLGGKAENYPRQVILGANVDVIIGVVNHEYQPAAYLVEITINGVRNKEINVSTLAHQQKWEQEISFVAQTLGDRQKVEFWLYRDSEAEPYLQDPLRLYIDVRPPD